MKYLKNRGEKVKNNNKTQQAITCQGQVHMNKKKMNVLSWVHGISQALGNALWLGTLLVPMSRP